MPKISRLLVCVVALSACLSMTACDTVAALLGEKLMGFDRATALSVATDVVNTGSDPKESLTVTGFKFIEQGMALSPCLSIRQTAEGFECAVTASELYWPAIDAADALDFEQTYYWLEFDEKRGYAFDPYGMGDPFDEASGFKFSRILLSDEDMSEFLGILESHDVLSWDGFDEHYVPDRELQVTDTGNRFEIKVLLSDGTLVHARGVDAYPDGYGDAVSAIKDFFDKHSDYTRYYPSELPDAQATSLVIEFAPQFGSRFTADFKIELVRGWNRWSVVLRDPKGEFLPAGTDIGDYGDVADAASLPFDRFIGLIDKYGLGTWNQSDEFDADKGGEICTIRIHFENGQEYHVSTNIYPDDYEQFRSDVIREIISYYDEVSQ